MKIRLRSCERVREVLRRHGIKYTKHNMGAGGQYPVDQVVVCEYVNLITRHKRTKIFPSVEFIQHSPRERVQLHVVFTSAAGNLHSARDMHEVRGFIKATNRAITTVKKVLRVFNSYMIEGGDTR